MAEILKNLNKEQKRVVTFGEGPLLVLAGAGSGKTKVLTHRVAYLADKKKIDPKQIALLTFTNKAATEMKKRVETMIGESKLGFAGTFHSFCVRILRTYGSVIGVMPNYVIYDSDDSEKAMIEVMKKLKIDHKEYKPSTFLAIIGRAKNDLIGIDELAKSADNTYKKEVIRAWREYQQLLKESRALDFDDLLCETVKVLGNESVRKEVNKNYVYVLIDEYQDTNKAQFEITRRLAGEKQNIMAVGDASQAIYSFRGADYRNLSMFSEAFANTTVMDLPTNYRSSQNILDVAYGVISHNTNHPVIRLVADKDKGANCVLLEARDEKEEAGMVVGRALKEKGESAILYRTNAQSRAFEEELIRRGVAYKLIGGVRFYNRAEIKDLIAYLRLLHNDEDKVARIRVEKIGIRRARAFDAWRESRSIDKWNNTGEILEEIINVTAFLERFDERNEDDVSRIENINELLAVASQFEKASDFLENASLSEAEIKQKYSEAKITLMTVHAAKGLEFDRVFVTGLEEGLFPHSRSILSGDKEEVEEERRLLYVAMTRAKTNLVLSFARNRLVFGGRRGGVPSRFLGEIPPLLIEREGEKKMFDEFGEKKRVVVQDWEIEAETKDDFAEIDNW